MERCKICGCENTSVIYRGPIKTGLLDGYTVKDYDVFQCGQCGTIWNNAIKDESVEFYESEEYRKRVDGDSKLSTCHEKHDGQVLDKLEMTGTDIFRDKVVADIGCGGGSFLDFVSGVAKKVLAVEPSQAFRKQLSEKGYAVYAYASDIVDMQGGVHIVTSFDVIEHVEDPYQFVAEMYDLLQDGGKCIVGTPTDYAVLRKLLGKMFDKFIFQVQHPWVFSQEALRILFEKAGFKNITITTKQKYGLGNLLAWLHEEKPRGDIKYPFITETLDATYRKEMGRLGGEYLVVKAEKIASVLNTFSTSML